MDGSTRKKDEVYRNNLARLTLHLGAPQRRQNWSKRRFSAEKWSRPETKHAPSNEYGICTCEQIYPACSRPFTHLTQVT